MKYKDDMFLNDMFLKNFEEKRIEFVEQYETNPHVAIIPYSYSFTEIASIAGISVVCSPKVFQIIFY